MSLYQKIHPAKMKLLEQEYLAKISLIDDESAEQIRALQNKIEDINKQKEKEQRAEEEKRYQKEVEDKKKQLDNSLYASEEYYKIKAELQEFENKREKELLNQKREDEKESLRVEIEAIREQANKKKEELEYKKFVAEQKLKNELDTLKQMQENLKEDLEERKKIEDEKAIKSTKTNKKITDNEKSENKSRKNDFKNLLKDNEIEFIKFKSSIKKLSYEIGRDFADGIKSTSGEINSYIDSLISRLQSKINNFQISEIKTHGSHRTGLNKVTFDDYKAILHKGEMVLTQPEAERYRQGQGNTLNAEINMNFYNVKE